MLYKHFQSRTYKEIKQTKCGHGDFLKGHHVLIRVSARALRFPGFPLKLAQDLFLYCVMIEPHPSHASVSLMLSDQ